MKKPETAFSICFLLLPSPHSSWPCSMPSCALVYLYCMCVLVWVLSRSVMSDSWQSHGLWPFRPLCPWNFPWKNTGVGCHFFFQGMFPTQGSNPCLLHSLPLIHLGHKDCITLILLFLTGFGRWKASVGRKRQSRIFLFPLPSSFDPGVLDTATPAASQPFSTACALTIFQWQSFLPWPPPARVDNSLPLL